MSYRLSAVRIFKLICSICNCKTYVAGEYYILEEDSEAFLLMLVLSQLRGILEMIYDELDLNY